jgi:Mn2+/Fe2+ NRAMP family transporter
MGLIRRSSPAGSTADTDPRSQSSARTAVRRPPARPPRECGGHREPLLWRALRKAWHAIGPGFITGASDDDPSGIATYSQTGAQYGFGLKGVKTDTKIGTAWAEGVQWAIMVVCATVLFRRGVTNITTAAQAASALEPLAGEYAKDLFAIGIVPARASVAKGPRMGALTTVRIA